MQLDASDFIAVCLAVLIAFGIAATLIETDRRDQVRRGWIIAGVLTAILLALGAVDIYRQSSRDVQFSTVVVAAVFSVLGTKGMVHATRRASSWARWMLVFVTALLMLFVGLLTGATGVSRFLPF